MSDVIVPQQPIRIPNLPTGLMVNEDRTATDDEMTFRQRLISSLQDNFGDEGMVAPSQTYANILLIAAGQEPDPLTGQIPATPPIYSCAPGTIIYDTTNDRLMVSILVAGVPTFKTVQVV